MWLIGMVTQTEGFHSTSHSNETSSCSQSAQSHTMSASHILLNMFFLLLLLYGISSKCTKTLLKFQRIFTQNKALNFSLWLISKILVSSMKESQAQTLSVRCSAQCPLRKFIIRGQEPEGPLLPSPLLQSPTKHLTMFIGFSSQQTNKATH